MALINSETGEYYKVSSVDTVNNQVVLDVFENSLHRQEGDTSYKQHRTLTEHIGEMNDIMNFSASGGLTIKNNLLTQIYHALKNRDIYGGYENA
jgi:hypothetical protein